MSYSKVFSTGLAMFSMFFGAGNVVFPLVLGQTAADQTPLALVGLLITAVGVPFLGMLAILLFKGDYQAFFFRAGKIPGFLLISAIMLLIGPFGGLPRCIALSFSTLKLSLPSLSFTGFSLFSCIVIFFLSYKKGQMINLLGYVLTPLLLITLAIIVGVGLWTGETSQTSSFTAMQSFWHGFMEGYNTMDLLASFFFSSMIYLNLKNQTHENDERAIFKLSLKASIVGGVLLAAVYAGFSLVAAWHGSSLALVNKGELLAAISLKILGPYAGLIASATIALACLTTAIALAAVFADFLHKSIFLNKISYIYSLIFTLAAAFFISLLEFNGIVNLLAPLLQVAYPALILFTIGNIISRLRKLKKLEEIPAVN